MAYVDDFALSQDSTFLSRVRMSMIKIALTVAATAPTADAVVDQKRNILATNVLNSPDLYVHRIATAAIENGGLVSGSTDGNLDTAVAAVWSAVAGVTTRD